MSQPFAASTEPDYDFVVVGSGFGGSVAALRLGEKGYRVLVVEQGREWTPDRLPRTNWRLRDWLWWPAAGLRGFFGLRLFGRVVVLHGNAVGGGSITYAGTLLTPQEKVWQQGGWAGLLDWPKEMAAHYATARRILGVAENARIGPADERLAEMASALGQTSDFGLTRVGIYFGQPDEPPGTPHPDPYFNGEGPARASCIGCGGCMMGCRHGAKNTLDLNYLHLARRYGAELLTETRVRAIHPRDSTDGSTGYELLLAPVPGNRGAAKRRITCRGVVCAASSLGTQELLLRMRADGSLPALSPALGKRVRTNAESLIGVRFPGGGVDLSLGVAIGSGFQLDADTHVEATRYPAGSDAMGLIATVMAQGRHRRLQWLGRLAFGALLRPLATWRLLRPRGFARESMILLCMQTVDGHLDMRLARPWWWPFRRRLSAAGTRIPANIPQASAFARALAARFGGQAMASLPEVLLDIPMTAHCLGGACIGATADQGACDAYGRAYGYRNFYLCDGSIVASNLGVNPSLTITALAEHVMHHVPHARDNDWRATGVERGTA